MSPKNKVREAATTFVRGTAFGWGKRDLATWLVCQYSPCLATDAVVEGEVRRLPAPTPSLGEEQVEEVILEARTLMLKLLGDLAWPSHRRTLADRAIRSGAVAQVSIEGNGTPNPISGDGRKVWAPVGRPSMRLATRVASLFLADALNYPGDYQNIALCRDCGALGLSGPIPHDALCERAARVA